MSISDYYLLIDVAWWWEVENVNVYMHVCIPVAAGDWKNWGGPEENQSTVSCYFIQVNYLTLLSNIQWKLSNNTMSYKTSLKKHFIKWLIYKTKKNTNKYPIYIYIIFYPPLMYTYVYICVCVYVCMYVCVCIYVCVYVYMHVYVGVYMCM